MAQKPKTEMVANALHPDPSQTIAPVKFTRKPNKSSSLRKSINLADVDQDTGGGAPVSGAAAEAEAEDSDGPVVIRPSLSRSGSTKQKKKPTSSRLSFGPEALSAEDDSSPATPQNKSLSQRAAENALRKKQPVNLPSRLLGGDDDRPRYSKEYLSELQSSTPNTPHDLSALTLADDEGDELAMALDELEGATVVPAPDTSAVGGALTSRTPAATILSAAQVREKKERRARLALQGGGDDDYIALDASDDDEGRLAGRKGGKESRLIAEDEDLGEGYDEYVEDGGLSLGRAAERKARLRRKKEMAELIASAEGPDDGGEGDDDDGENSDDSLDRRAEYEAAQRRKGMGVEILEPGGEGGGADVIPKMKPLPDLDECLQRMRDLVQGLEDEVRLKRARIAALQKEREEIVQREAEVQEVLDKAGAKYQAVLGSRAGAGATADVAKLAAQSPLRNPSMPLPPGLAMPGLVVERGLESFGTTPTARPEDEDMT